MKIHDLLSSVIPPFALAYEPISIPLSSPTEAQRITNEALLLFSTGKTPDQIKQLSDTKGLPLRRTGVGRGVRYELFLADYRAWIARLPKD